MVKVCIATLFVDALSLIAARRLDGWILCVTGSTVRSSLAISSPVKNIFTLTRRCCKEKSSSIIRVGLDGI